MTSQTRCHCPSCTIRGLMGPAVVITVGVLFLLSEIRGGSFFFGNTWPFILVVIGAVQVAAAFAPRDGHIDLPQPGTPPSPPVAPPAPPPVPSQNPYGTQGQ